MRECSTKKMSDTQKRAEVPPNITIRDKLLDCREELEAACHQLVQAQQRVHKEKVPFGRELHWKGIPERRFVPITLSGRTFEIHLQSSPLIDESEGLCTKYVSKILQFLTHPSPCIHCDINVTT